VSSASFNIINVHIIALENSLGESFYHGFHLIYYTIETHTYKHMRKSVSFQCKINLFLFFIYLQTTPTSTWTELVSAKENIKRDKTDLLQEECKTQFWSIHLSLHSMA
jgi:hypothetical protein